MTCSRAEQQDVSHLSQKHDKLTLGKTLGEGAFGTVVLGEFKGKKVAIKTVRTTKVTAATVTEASRRPSLD